MTWMLEDELDALAPRWRVKQDPDGCGDVLIDLVERARIGDRVVDAVEARRRREVAGRDLALADVIEATLRS